MGLSLPQGCCGAFEILRPSIAQYSEVGHSAPGPSEEAD